jgi:transketolase
MFAAHHKLSNLTVIIDLNGQQALGYTDQVLSLAPLSARFAAFGWDTHEVDGHDVGAMSETITGLSSRGGAPHVLVARTTFGKGVSYMENQIKWHYWPMSETEYDQACQEVAAQGHAAS